MTKPTDEEKLREAAALARAHGMYIVPRREYRNGKEFLMYYLFRRLKFADHGIRVGKRNNATGLLKLVKIAKEVI